MPDSSRFWDRLAVMVELVARSPAQKLGRTAIVKLLYFLQALRNVPLDYNFRLHTYGPFDSDVLDDLAYAESLGAVSSKVVSYPSGYGYEVQRGSKADDFQEKGRAFLRQYGDDIDWVAERFARRNASELELLSTIVYADRELANRGDHAPAERIVRMVHEIKRHFPSESIRTEFENLQREKLLNSC